MAPDRSDGGVGIVDRYPPAAADGRAAGAADRARPDTAGAGAGGGGDNGDGRPDGVGEASGGKPGYRTALSWSVAMVGGQQVLTAGVSFLLAAILGPESFGTVAMASIYILFMQMLLEQAMPALVQRERLEPEHLDSAFWLVLGATLVVTAASVALAGPWAAVNRTPELRPIIIVLSLQVPLQGLIVVQEALLRRRMDFRSLAVRSLVAAGAGGVVGLAMAMRGAGSWSLVGQQLATGLVGAVVLWSVSDWRPRFRFSRSHVRDLAGFSAGSFLANLGVFVNVRSDVMLIGVFFGGVAVGLYRLASRFTEIFVDFLSRSMHQVAFPELSRLQTDKVAFADRKRDILAQSSLLTLPALGILAGCADQLLRLFGDEWAGASGVLQVLCAVAAVRALALISSAGLQAIGRPHILAVLSWVAAAISAASLAAVGVAMRDAPVAEQVQAMALSRAAVFFGVIGPAYVVAIHRICGLSPRRLIGAINGPALVGAVTAIVGAGWSATRVDRGWAAPVALVAAGLLTCTVALALTAVSDRPKLDRAIRLVRGVVPLPSWGTGTYKPRHIQVAIAGSVLDGPPSELDGYTPRHLATPSAAEVTATRSAFTHSDQGTYTANVSPLGRDGPPASPEATATSAHPSGASPAGRGTNPSDHLRGALSVDLWTSLGVIVRRWKVAVPVVFLTAVASVLIGGVISPSYEAGTTLLLVGPGLAGAPVATTTVPGATTTTTAAPAPGAAAAPTTTAPNLAEDGNPNPLLTLNSSLNSTARASLEAISDDGVRRSLAESGLSTEYSVTASDQDPILRITVTADSADGALDTMGALRATLLADLTARQDEAGAPETSRIQVQTLSETNQPSPIYQSRRRAQLVVVALGLVLAAVAAFGVEGLSERRLQQARLKVGGAMDGGSHLAPGSAPGPRFRREEPGRDEPGGDEGDERRAPSGVAVETLTGERQPPPPAPVHGHDDDVHGNGWR